LSILYHDNYDNSNHVDDKNSRCIILDFQKKSQTNLGFFDDM